MLSQFFILSARGDTIITRDCNCSYLLKRNIVRLDLGRETSEIFFRKVKFWQGDPPPCFNVDGINYFYTKKFGIFFVISMRGDTILHKECNLLGFLNSLISQDGPGCGQVHDYVGDIPIEGGDH